MSVSIAELVGSKALQKYHKIVTILVTIALICSLWLGSGVVRAAASSTDWNPLNITSAIIWTQGNSTSTIYRDSYDDIAIPLYMSLSVSDNFGNLNYISGYINNNFSTNFSFKDSQNLNCSYLYFEPYSEAGISTRLSPQSNNVFISFDNVRYTFGYGVLIGWFHVSVNSANTANSTIIYYNLTSIDITSGNKYFIASRGETGLTYAVIQAIDNASDINTIILHLLNIQNNTALLDYIIDYLANHRNLTEIYNQLVSLNATETLLYNEIYNYIHQSNAGANAASQAASELGSEAANQGNIEESLVALAPGNISDLDSADAFGVLDDIQLSTAFWVDAVHQFSIESGILWGIFIFALIIGLIAFILRLR